MPTVLTYKQSGGRVSKTARLQLATHGKKNSIKMAKYRIERA